MLKRHGVVSNWQKGALPGLNTAPPLFMAQQQLQQETPNYVFSFDARKAFDTAKQGALHLIPRHLSVPPAVIDLLLFLHTAIRLRIATAHGLTQCSQSTCRPAYSMATPRAACCRHSCWIPHSGPRGTAYARRLRPGGASCRPI